MGAATQTKKSAAHIGDWTRASIMKYSMNNTKLWYRKMSKTLQTSRIRAVVRAAYRRVQEEGNDDERDHELYREHEDERAPEAQSKKEKAEKAAEKKVSSGIFLSTNSLVLQAENIASWKKPRIIEYPRLSSKQQHPCRVQNQSFKPNPHQRRRHQQHLRRHHYCTSHWSVRASGRGSPRRRQTRLPVEVKRTFDSGTTARIRGLEKTTSATHE